VRLTKGHKANRKRMATVAAVFTRLGCAPQNRSWKACSVLKRQIPSDEQIPLRPENKRVWASLLKGKTAVIEEVAQEMQRPDPQGIKTRVALTDGERTLTDSGRRDARRHPDPLPAMRGYFIHAGPPKAP